MLVDQRTTTGRRLAVAGALAGCLFVSGRGVFASEQTRQTQTPTTQPATRPAAAPTSTLRIGGDEAVKMALENNLGLQTERLNPQLQALAVAGALSAYTPELFGSTVRNSNTSPPRDFLSQGVDVTSSGAITADGGIRQVLPWGGRYSLGMSGFRSTSNAPRTSYSPQLQSDLDASYTQPLLRGLTIDGFRQSVLQNRNQQAIADIQLAERITQTSRTVRNAYFNLVAAIGSLRVAEQSLDLARESYKNNQRRVEVGVMAPIDIVEAEAEVARQDEFVILRKAAIESAEDQLRTLIMNPAQSDFWTTRIEPAEQPILTQQPIVDVEAAIRNALVNRTDLLQLKKQIEGADLSIKYNENQRLPALDVTARYGLTGVGGTQFAYGTQPADGSPPPIVSETQRSFAQVLRDVFGNDFPAWSVAVNISYPLGSSSADVALATSRLQRQQAQVAMRDLEMRITTQVREAARDVATGLKQIEATAKARELAERQREAQEKRLSVGLSDTFRLLQAQRDLTAQLQAELNAIIAYNRALIDFEAVQTIPVGGGF